MPFEDQEMFIVRCECKFLLVRSPKWLRENPHPSCPRCGRDITKSREEAMQEVMEVERRLADRVDYETW